MKNTIKVYRTMHDSTQETLANTREVTRQTIIAVEKDRDDPSLSLAFAIARFLGVTIEELFQDGGEGDVRLCLLAPKVIFI